MFKRANKITALLVAAASVMSIVPAMAADSTRLGTKDGTIESAIAFNGKYIYEGYKGDESKAVWFNDGEKDKELTDFEDYDFTQGDDNILTYGDKYMLAEDNDDYYLTDLSNGNITDDTLEDKLDSTASKIEKALSKTDKYDGAVIEAKDLHYVKDSAAYQEPWYSVARTHENKDTTIFTDANGKYVDASVLANIYAYSSKRQEVVKIDKFDTEYKDTLLKVDLVKQPQVIAQDKDNLYAIVNVNVTDSNSIVQTNAANAVGTVDLTDAKTELQKTVTAATAAEITWSATTGSAVTIAGHAFAAADNVTVGGFQTKVADYFISNPIAGYAYDRDNNKFVATTKGVVIDSKKPVFVAPDVAVFHNGTPGSTETTATQVPQIVVAGITFKFDTATPATADTATIKYYKTDSELKNKIIAQFAGHTTTAVSGNVYTFDATTLTFTAASALTDAQVETDLGDVIGKSGNGASLGVRVTNAWYLQKISKAQGSTDEEASIPKEVKSYHMDTKALYDNGDVKDATDWLITDGKVNTFAHVEVKDNSLYAYKVNSNNDNVKVLKLDLKQIKENPADKATFGDSKLDGYVVKKDGDTDQDFEAWSVDSNGILWVLNDGKIIKFAEKDKTTTYTCDSGLDQLSVYDGKNLIAWSEDDERYTTVTEGTAVTAGEATAVAPVIVTGWVAGTDGTWTFNDATGAKVVSKWVNVGGAWYYLKADGIMATGWYNDNGTWYYLNASGAMATGWVNDGGTWYYCNASGAMLANTTVDGYVLNGSGAWVK